MNRGSVALLVLLAAAVPAHAATGGAEPQIVTKTYEGISYYSGGVTIEERAAIPQRFPMKIVFHTDKGNLLCNAEVTVSSKGKVVFRGSAENGPWLFIDLPAGTYDVKAVQDGAAKAKKGVKLVAGRPRTVNLRWKTAEVDMGLKD
jgi:hypothetical protein